MASNSCQQNGNQQGSSSDQHFRLVDAQSYLFSSKAFNEDSFAIMISYEVNEGLCTPAMLNKGL